MYRRDESHLSQRQAKQLAEAIQPDIRRAAFTEFARLINGIAATYRFSAAGGSAQPSNAVVRGHLRSIETKANAIVADLEALGDDGAFLLALALGCAPNHPSGATVLNTLTDYIRELGPAAALARGMSSRGSDRRPRYALGFAVGQLAVLWKNFAGKPFTHTRGEMGEPTSDGGRFIMAFFGMIDPKVTPSMITTELDRRRKARPVVVKEVK
jgi:hypothetical protein